VTTLAAAVVVGAVASALLWRLAGGVLAHPGLARTNVRGRPVPTAGGVLFPLALLPLWAFALVDLARGWDLWSRELGFAATGALGPVVVFALLGLVDDLLAVGDDRGFRGHLRALARGRLTTGAIKLLGGGVAAVGFAVTAGSAGRPLWELGVDGAIVALGANLANLLDRAPGRVTKVSVLALVALVAAGSADDRAVLGGAALVVGLAVGLLVPELRERVMLGDTGANPLGAALGLAAVTTLDTAARLVVLAVLVALNAASERVSFSAVIERTPPLRWLDRLGRE
jgi:UDP-N-acetylmuramyl pentapeptide phosphotransferase/UDP-N-acetylglucosamine-1-phosphate transferase